MRRVALYGAPTAGAEWQKCYSALLLGLERRFGKGRIVQRTTKFFDRADVYNDVALAVVLCLRQRGIDYLNAYRSLGIPVLVVDYGWSRRDLGYWQVSPNGLNNIPPTAPSDDRFRGLGLEVRSLARPAYNVVICGQTPGDMQHDIVSEAEMRQWGYRTAVEVRKRKPDCRIYWRPHPHCQITVPKPAITTSVTRHPNDFIWEERIETCVTYNSTVGIDFLRRGCKLIALGPRTVYSHIAYSSLDGLEANHHDVGQVRDMMVRLAYGQYKLSELENWETLRQLLELHQITGDW